MVLHCKRSRFLGRDVFPAASKGATHASRGWPGARRMRLASGHGWPLRACAEQGLRSAMATPGLRAAGTAQRNVLRRERVLPQPGLRSPEQRDADKAPDDEV